MNLLRLREALLNNPIAYVSLDATHPDITFARFIACRSLSAFAGDLSR